ncbi:MAG: chloride channel protein [Sulfuricellaceae bacterium]
MWKRRLVFWCGAISVGLAAVAFAVGSDFTHTFFHRLLAYSPYLPLIVTPLGLALVVALTRRFFPGSQGSGIPQSIAALGRQDAGTRGSVLSLRIAVGKILMTLLGLLSGASIILESSVDRLPICITHWF